MSAPSTTSSTTVEKRPTFDPDCPIAARNPHHVCDFGFAGGGECIYGMAEARRVRDAELTAAACPGCWSGQTSHDGSEYCESGSIASGGTREHCTCSVCW